MKVETWHFYQLSKIVVHRFFDHISNIFVIDLKNRFKFKYLLDTWNSNLIEVGDKQIIFDH